jgi:hypothetical protein
VARFTAKLPPAVRYGVVINHGRLPAVALAELRAEGCATRPGSHPEAAFGPMGSGVAQARR